MKTLLGNPSHEFSLIPFWFWNDRLQERELLRQMDDFCAHGVYGFVIHPRVGLPRSIGFMSRRMLEFIRLVVSEAARRKMRVVLYDEGMYPSGSASGLVVKHNPDHHCRCFCQQALRPDRQPRLAKGQTLVAIVKRSHGQRLAVIDRPVDAVIRGLHFRGRGPDEDEPPAGDILNPEAVRSFIQIVYERFYETVGDFFGSTVMGVFTDEANPLGKCREAMVVPGTTGFLQEVNRLLGYDFTPHLPSLWYDDEPDARRHRQEYERAVALRLSETYYRPLSEWCNRRGISFMGHPAYPMSIGIERHFHVPGQDTVWRCVLPKSANGLEGPDSTMAKCTSSAMIHLGRRRNSNECYGAYGHELTWEEMKTLADWLLVRGVNMLIPHAFYYSVRGPRRDERPPDVGPHSSWWNTYPAFARYCARLCWLNTDCRHVCRVAILAGKEFLPWQAAKICYQNQIDFNYLEARHLWEDAREDRTGIRLGGMRYRVLIVEDALEIPRSAKPILRQLERYGLLVHYSATNGDRRLLNAMDRLVPRDLSVTPVQPDLRCRHVSKNRIHYYLLTNEGKTDIHFIPSLASKDGMRLVDPFIERSEKYHPGQSIRLTPIQSRIIEIHPVNQEDIKK